MRQYQEIVREILENGEEKGDRTGTGTLSVFGVQKKYDLSEGFPLVTVKKTLFDAVIRELLWLLNGSTNINDNLTQHTPIWDAWADEEGELGPIYGYQWRKWPRMHRNIKTGQIEESHIDQIQNAIDMIKNNPESRRIIVNAWNVGQIEEMALPPCHTFFQFYVAQGKLSCQLYQRSADVGLGVPFNIASYSALLIMMAQECGLEPGTFVHTMGDAHIYKDHIADLKVILDREPLPLPTLKVAKKPFWEIKFEDFELENYQHHPFIKLPVSV